jgi:predicted nicotinamide N-methyase
VADLVDFINAHTVIRPVPYVPEVVMHSADEAIPLWEETETRSGGESLPPPFWAFPWAGGQGLARYVLDHPDVVRGKAVLDLAAGGGLVAVAAALASAARVVANEIDAYADAAIEANAVANHVVVDRELGDLLDGDGRGFDVVLAGDVFYSGAMAARMLAFLRRAASAGAIVLVGDPGRAYAPQDQETVAVYDVPVIRDLEDADTKRVRILRIA